MKRFTLYLILLLVSMQTKAIEQPEFSTAGFYVLANSGRSVYSMNPGWRFFKGKQSGAYEKDFKDDSWEKVSLPHGIEYLPTEASGCYNYQGEVWYRKHFMPDSQLKGKKLYLHFEAVMGKSKIYVNGHLLASHYGGYLPISVDVTDYLCWETDNVVAVCADNSNDPLFPPGKEQEMLDYTYFGGIYRDCWLVSHNPVHLTDPNQEDEIAGGGLFVSFGKISEKQAEINLMVQVRNEGLKTFTGNLKYELLDANGHIVTTAQNSVKIKGGAACVSKNRMWVNSPSLWSPDSPTLYKLKVKISDRAGNIIDGYYQRIGIRSIEFKGKEGFWLNGKPYGRPLIGANRHQDFAVLGNAVPNSIHWRDAKKLKDTGLSVIRNAHCPQDPAFMDACDELGLFVIDNTPGWQFWNNEPVFAERVYSDIRHLVRRDRNHACIWLWEPILNETWYPDDFAKRVCDIVNEEYPYPYCYCGSDSEARGSEYYPVQFAHPAQMLDAANAIDSTKTYFTREWGDNVDDWSSHNSPSRVARNWGEQPMRIQAQHYAHSKYPVTNFEVLYKQSPQHVGGCLWHSFDHQRGYHPDPFYGGLMDVFRQPKYSYYMFMAQRPSQSNPALIAESGPMVYIAHEMTPFSGSDVIVYSNCEEVRLTFNKDGKPSVYKKENREKGMPSPVITFPGVYDFMKDKQLSREGKQDDVYLLAEGLIAGKVVATHKVAPARRAEKIVLWLDDEGTKLIADGSDVITVVAAIADKNGNIKRLNNEYISFSVEGEGRILGGPEILANPAPVKWGTAPVLIQSTLQPGRIKVTASVMFEGSQKPIRGELEFHSIPSSVYCIYKPTDISRKDDVFVKSSRKKSEEELKKELEKVRQELRRYKLKEVELQQTEFGE